MTEKGLLCSAGIILALFAVLSHGQPNTAPVIQIPEGDMVNVGELETNSRMIYPFTITDAEDDWFTCKLKIDDEHGEDKDHDEFLLTNSSRTSWQFEIAPGADFHPDEVYELEIECDDGDEKSEKIKLYVHVGQGQDIFWNYGGTQVTTPSVDASTTKAGDVVYTLQATNTLNHPFGYIKTGESMSNRALAGPNGNYFFIDEATGDIIALQDLEHIPSDIIRANLNFYAIEEELKIWGSGRLPFSNQNDRPSTTTLPLTQSKPESITSADILFTLVIDDASYAGQPHTVKLDCTPAEWENLFELDGGFNFRLKPGKKVDYETGNRNYDCTFVINDGLHDSDTYQYSLTITEVNEPPKFSTSMYYVTINEGPAGSASAPSNIDCYDEDVQNGPEPLTYSFRSDTCSAYFNIDAAGLITLAQDLDVDAVGSATQCVLEVRCTDNQGLMTTASITMSFKDINDNAPVIANSFTMYSDNTMTNGETIIGTLIATDADSGPNGEVSCPSATPTSMPASYASCYSVMPSCDVLLVCDIASTLPFNTLVSYDVTVTDHGNPAQTTTTTLNVIYRQVFTTGTSTTIATTTVDNFWFHPENIALTALAALFSLILLALLTLCCLRYCWGRNLCGRCLSSCRRMLCRSKEPESRPREDSSSSNSESGRSTETTSDTDALLTHWSLASHKRDIGKQCRPRSDAAEKRRFI